MTSSGTEAAAQLAATRGLNWKRGAIALVLAALVVGLGHLYDRRWRLAVIYELVFPVLFLLVRTVALHRDILAAMVIILGGAILQLFVIGQAVWFSLQRPKGLPLPRIGRLPLVTAVITAILTTVGWGTGFFPGHVLGFKGYKISSDSMAPTLQTGDRVLVDAQAYTTSRPQRGDLVVFIEAPNLTLAKRVIGLGGDTLDFTNQTVVLDGHPLKESYLAPPDPSADSQRVFPEHTVRPGDLFVLGDNRDHSYDSRYFGDISNGSVIGKVIGVYWSHDRSRIGSTLR